MNTRTKAKKIDVQFIDPLTQPAKEDALINDVSNKYGGEVKAYKGFLDDYAKQYKTIKDETSLLNPRASATLPFDKVQDQDLARAMLLIIDTVQGFPQFSRQQAGQHRSPAEAEAAGL